MFYKSICLIIIHNYKLHELENPTRKKTLSAFLLKGKQKIANSTPLRPDVEWFDAREREFWMFLF